MDPRIHRLAAASISRRRDQDLFQDEFPNINEYFPERQPSLSPVPELTRRNLSKQAAVDHARACEPTLNQCVRCRKQSQRERRIVDCHFDSDPEYLIEFMIEDYQLNVCANCRGPGRACFKCPPEVAAQTTQCSLILQRYYAARNENNAALMERYARDYHNLNDAILVRIGIHYPEEKNKLRAHDGLEDNGQPPYTVDRLSKADAAKEVEKSVREGDLQSGLQYGQYRKTVVRGLYGFRPVVEAIPPIQRPNPTQGGFFVHSALHRNEVVRPGEQPTAATILQPDTPRQGAGIFGLGSRATPSGPNGYWEMNLHRNHPQAGLRPFPTDFNLRPAPAGSPLRSVEATRRTAQGLRAGNHWDYNPNNANANNADRNDNAHQQEPVWGLSPSARRNAAPREGRFNDEPIPFRGGSPAEEANARRQARNRGHQRTPSPPQPRRRQRHN